MLPNRSSKYIKYLQIAHEYARAKSGCLKVVVGSAIVFRDLEGYVTVSMGANKAIPDDCRGLKRCQVDGHCVSTIHSEIDAIVEAATDLTGCTIYVTRYPCESCARAIVTAGIKKVVYGRKLEISAKTALIFKQCGVEVVHVPEFDEEDLYGQVQ